MSVLRYRNIVGELTEAVLDVRPGGEGKITPLSLGSAPDAAQHIHLSGGEIHPRQAQIIGSHTAKAYAFVLSGDAIFINNRHLEMIRVLRHGDELQIAGVQLLYLDFVPRRLTEGSPIHQQRCALSGCTKAWKTGVEIIVCPWCGQTYHAACWLRLKHCVTPDCYPIRQMLLAELSGQIKLDKMVETPNITGQLCVARCRRNEPIKVGEEILRCPNSQCGVYHPDCWLAMRGPCPECKLDIPNVLNQWVFRANWGT